MCGALMLFKISFGDERASLWFSQLSTILFILHAHRRGKTVWKLFRGRQQSPRCERTMPNLPAAPPAPCSRRVVPQVSSASFHQAFQMMRCWKCALPRLCSAIVFLDSSACCVAMLSGRSMHPALHLIKSLVSQRRRSAS